MKNNKQKQLLSSYRAYVLVPAFVVAAILIATVVLVALYAHTSAMGFLIALSVVLTLIGGLIPARSASKKDPVEALRTE